MVKKLPLLLMVMLLWAVSARSETVVIVKGRPIQVYERVEADFTKALTQNFRAKAEKTISPLRIEIYDLSSESGRSLSTYLSNSKPDLLFAIGGAALAAARNFSTPPVVAALAVIGGQESAKPLVSGVDVVAPATKWLDATESMLHAGKRVGLVVGEGAPDAWLLKARAAAAARGVQLMETSASSPKKVRQALTLLAGRIDVLWLVPDLRVITQESIDEVLLYGAENRLPVVAFSEKYLRSGAALTIEPDLDFLGGQAAAIAAAILSGAYPSGRGFEEAERSRVNFNPEIFGKLGIALPKSAVPAGGEPR